MDYEQILEIVRLAYLAGGNDSEENSFRYCVQGSKERAEEIIEELITDEIIPNIKG